MERTVYETGWNVFLIKKFVVMLEYILMRLSIIAAECVPDVTTSRNRRNVFFYETINSSKKNLSLMRKSVIKGGGTSVLVSGSMCSLRDHK
jgi:hypothetical protein